ncbi:SPW repeat protein [Natrarchaeobaculum aegyptiacum]|uniref:SPW repeat-containing integral membrane domain-containing protein n=1 Tax=Natrarchaeobaculum aegyptiacum TaxID=745377 RepID=A0A2Z2HQP5_9EURY|nr:SPW repeat protein [Natrarchaeobaculum aegyptiacum]ARS88325.1 hypothetical protein B1756_00150 [Natrarchaeobaculum aegyptiacum]
MSDSSADPTDDRGTDRSTEQRSADRTSDAQGRKWLSGFVSLIGLWIAISPFLYEAAASMLWSSVIVGAGIFLLAGYNFYRHVADHPTSLGVMSLVALLGLWVLVSPFAMAGEFAIDGLEVAGEGLIWSSVVAGILTAILAAYIAYDARSDVRTGAPAGTQ